MPYVKTVRVNGTEYAISTRGSRMPIACEFGVSDSGIVKLDNTPDDNTTVYSEADDSIPIAVRRTGQSGSYEYSVVLLVDDVDGIRFYRNDGSNTYDVAIS